MPSEAQEFAAWFAEQYEQRLPGNPKYFLRWAKEVTQLKALLEFYGVARLKQLTIAMLESNDPFIENSDKGIGVLVIKANWLEARLRAAEAKQGETRLRQVK